METNIAHIIKNLATLFSNLHPQFKNYQQTDFSKTRFFFAGFYFIVQIALYEQAFNIINLPAKTGPQITTHLPLLHLGWDQTATLLVLHIVNFSLSKNKEVVGKTIVLH